MAGRKRAGIALDLRKADVASAHELMPAGSGKRARLSDLLYGQIFEQIVSRKSRTPSKAGGLILLAPQRGKKLASPEGEPSPDISSV